MVLVGVALSAFVWAAWPTVSAPAAPPPTSPQIAGPVEPKSVSEGQPVRSLASVKRQPATFGPAPVPSELETSGDYVQEPPEELGAEPLPGAELTREPPPVVG